MTVLTIPSTEAESAAQFDYANAKPAELPVATNFSAELAQNDLILALSSQSFRGNPGVSKGSPGDGETRPVMLPVSTFVMDDAAPQEAGTSQHPFSTARADGYTGSTNKIYPFRASGKLFYTKPTGPTWCSASLIARGVVLTAAHCVATFGTNAFYTNFQFVPGYKNGTAPYGVWTAVQVRAMTSYLNGTDQCSQRGVICANDIAILVLSPQGGHYAGANTGWYSYGYNGFGFTPSNLAHVTQLGYPSCLDNANIMARNDSHGFKSASNANNTLIGSLMCGGSSGGPWITNLEGDRLSPARLRVPMQ